MISRVGEAIKLPYSNNRMSLTLERFIMKVQELEIKRLASALRRQIVILRATRAGLRVVQTKWLRKAGEAANQ